MVAYAYLSKGKVAGKVSSRFLHVVAADIILVVDLVAVELQCLVHVVHLHTAVAESRFEINLLF